MGNGTKFAVAGMLAVALAGVLFMWMGGGSGGQLFGVPIGHQRYQPPAFPRGHTNAVAVAAREHGVYLGEPDGLREFIGYRPDTQICVYRGEWSATRGGQPVTVAVTAEHEGQWRVTSWIEK